jgi:restriction system protein
LLVPRRPQTTTSPKRNSDVHQLRKALEDNRCLVGERLLSRLRTLPPSAFERFAALLFRRMGYHDVTVTSRTGDGGLGIVALGNIGVNSVRIAGQVKRWKHAVQRKVIDELRGSMARAGATHGIVVSTSSFSDGARKAVDLPGLPPVALIDGLALLELTLRHSLGVREESVALWTMRNEFFDRLCQASRTDANASQAKLAGFCAGSRNDPERSSLTEYRVGSEHE